jgi:hypothetical protein
VKRDVLANLETARTAIFLDLALAYLVETSTTTADPPLEGLRWKEASGFLP